VLEPRYNVLLDGTVNLPWVGSVSVQNLTLEEAAAVLSQRYGRFIRNPVVTVTLVAPRPLKIGVIGEVNRPGSYIISVISNESTLAGLTQRTGSEGGNQWPTVSRAIQTAGGITEIANVRGIEVRRPRRDTGEAEIVRVDLWRFLQAGDLSQDILLRDGDTISIPTVTDLDAAEVTKLAVSNFSPEAIRVNVVGEVITPGVVTIRPNSTLSQAVLAAGGFRKGRADQDVELIRLNPNGTVTRRQVEVELSSNLDDKTNPPLRNNDIIVVRRNTFASVTDTLAPILSPFSGLLGILNVLGIPFPTR
jgi:polysaccharide export outer membrane protein